MFNSQYKYVFIIYNLKYKIYFGIYNLKHIFCILDFTF